jgi:predicted PurR-regulated permease PerM
VKVPSSNLGEPILAWGNMEKRLKILLLIAVSAIVLAILFLKPLLVMILSALLLSYICYPAYSLINRFLKHKSISAFIVVVLILVIFMVPSYFIVNSLSKEVFASYIKMKQSLSVEGGCTTVACAVISALPLSNIDVNVRTLLEQNIGNGTAYFFTMLSDVIISLPNIIFQFFMILFLTYYILKDAPLLIASIKQILPIKKSYQDELFARINEVAKAVIFGYIIIAIIQGILAGIGFYFTGITSPILWGLVTIVTALVPFLGAFAVWFSLAVVHFFNGYIANEPAVMLQAIILSAYGLLIISSMDNILKPKIIGATAKIHPALILLGVVGGIYLLGPIGIVVGPLFLALVETAIVIYEKEKKLTLNC